MRVLLFFECPALVLAPFLILPYIGMGITEHRAIGKAAAQGWKRRHHIFDAAGKPLSRLESRVLGSYILVIRTCKSSKA